jgi:hypothetical protein
MRNVKVVILIALLSACGFMTGGCLETAGPAAAGFAASETLQGIEADLKAREQAALDEYESAVEQIELAASEAEKKAAQAKAEAAAQEIKIARTGQDAIQTFRKTQEQDWSSPEGIIAGLLGLGVTGYGVYERFRRKEVDRERKTERSDREAILEGLQKFLAQTEPETAERLRQEINEKRKQAGAVT